MPLLALTDVCTPWQHSPAPFAASSMRWPERKGAWYKPDWAKLTSLVAKLRAIPHCLRLARLAHADKLAHKRRRSCFRIISRIPLSFHSATHFGGSMKVMLTGTDTPLVVHGFGFFREHLAAIVSIAVLLPLSLYLNWRLGLPAHRTVPHLRATGVRAAQDRGHAESVESSYSDLAERLPTRSAMWRWCMLHSRRGRGAAEKRQVVERLLGATVPALPGGRSSPPSPKASTTLTMLAILILGLFLFARGQDDRRHRHVHELCRHAPIQRLDNRRRGSSTPAPMTAVRLEEFFGVLDATTSVHCTSGDAERGRRRGSLWRHLLLMTAGACWSKASPSRPSQARPLRWSAPRCSKVHGDGAALSRLRSAIR